MRPLLVARQPIYDVNVDVFAYELLFWQQGAVEQGAVGGDRATTSVVLNAFAEGQIDAILGPHPGFVNLTGNLLRTGAARALPKERVVLEILEDVEVDAPLLHALRALVADGYALALDDFVWRPELEPLLALARYVKLDVRALGRERLAEEVARLRRWPVRLLAEKIETHEEFDYTRALGIELFQGYFLCRPALVEGQAATGRARLLDLLARAHDRGALAPLVAADVPLSYRLLRIVSSPLLGEARRVESMTHALELLGDGTRAWVSLLALGGIEEKPPALFDTAARRARMCQALAREAALPGGGDYFLAGLYSVADALLDRSLDEILGAVPLPDEVTTALRGGGGPIGEALSCVLAQEDARFEEVTFGALSSAQIQRAWLEGIIWAAQVRRYTAR